MTSLYQKDLTRCYQPLTKDQQSALHKKISQGDSTARDTVIHSCLPLVMSIAKKFRYNNKHIDLEDMIQEGNIALISAVDKWDIQKGNITTVATWYVRNSLIDMITDAKYTIKHPYSLSRRAAEELRKVKNINSTDIDYVAEQTNLSTKRVKKLLSVSPRGTSRLNLEQNPDVQNKYINSDDEPEQEVTKPCIADLVSLINQHLQGDQRRIFCLWSGIFSKKIGPKAIANLLDKTEQYVYDNIYSAKRILSTAANKVNTNA